MTRGKERLTIGLLVICLITFIVAPDALTCPVAMRETDAAARTVVWSEPQDPYHSLAQEIAHTDGLPLAVALDAALAHEPEFLLWVVSPEQLSEEIFSDFGAALQRHGKGVSVGLISGSTIDTARALWRRRPDYTPSFLMSTLLMASGGAWLNLHARSRWARSGTFLAILFPSWATAVFWLGSVALVNALARQRVGLPLYAYGGGLMPLIACAVEGTVAALALWCARRLDRADASSGEHDASPV